VNKSTDIDLFAIKTYLVNKGWKKVNHPNERLMIYQSPLGRFSNTIQIILPKEEMYSDVGRRISDAISIVSSVYRIAKEDVLNRAGSK